MGFRIQNNIEAMNAQRQLGISSGQLTKSLERLSSGYRINKAADDAAGLAISSSFRANIASFKVASRNTSEANSLLQVAEGGMDQITNMLTRLKELSTQAASANVGSSERVKINAEGNALISEIDRIANSTKYGSTNLLDGTFGSSKTNTTGAPTGSQMITSTYNYATLSSIGGTVLSTATVAAVGSAVTESAKWYVSANTATTSIIIANNAVLSTATMQETATISGSISAATSISFTNLGITLTFTSATDLTGGTFATASAGSGTTVSSGITVIRTGLTSVNVESATAGTYTIADAGGVVTIGNGSTTQAVTYVAGQTLDFNALGISFSLNTTDYTANDLNGMSFVIADSGTGGSTFQIGAENNTNNRISLSIGNVVGTSTNGLNLSMDQLTTAANAQSMLDTIDSAISTLSSKRGDLGAAMNRLSYAAANLATTIENTQAAESVIRDVDMASEMTTFTKNQILQQAGTSMLSQANQAPQMILSLFQ